ncbi:hypothetical protein C4A77_05870 [Brevibacillus laterosporus]|uniref:Uncharacterized protein n=1 Tax=Brevibacillus laterosporus TaxID=1465 RepID=A0AAP8U672_BRELA|nr:hypothetical protein C4A77_05870 [Brevibacillus laterosporus]
MYFSPVKKRVPFIVFTLISITIQLLVLIKTTEGILFIVPIIIGIVMLFSWWKIIYTMFEPITVEEKISLINKISLRAVMVVIISICLFPIEMLLR